MAVRATSNTARRLPLPPATTMRLAGDRVACASCERVDFEVRFFAADLPLCEECERDEALVATGSGP